MADAIDDISERTNILYKCTYKSLVIGAKTLEIIFISDYQAHGLMLQMLSMNFLTHSLLLCINTEPQLENKVLHLYKTIQ